MTLEGKAAAITGGNSGIGLAIARELRGGGASVAILGRDRASLAAASDELGPDTVAVSGDVGEIADLERFFAEVRERFGGIDILVANAGLYRSMPLAETTPEFFDAICGANFRGCFFTVQRSLPLLNDGASVVLVSSTINQAGVPGLSIYAATKAAVRSLARGLAAELHPRGIRVNAVSPGIIDSPIFDRLDMDGDQVAGLKDSLRGQVPIGRLGTAAEVAGAVLFLVSDAASYITGCELPVSGGLGQI